MSKTKKHTKRVSRKARKTTSDLIVSHAETHLSQNKEISLGVFTFAVAGLVIVLSAFALLNFSLRSNEAFIAKDAMDYASQEAFYSNETMHASASYNMQVIQEKIRSAAQAKEMSKTLSSLSAILILGLLWYLHKDGFFDRNRAGFTIRKIR